MLQISNTSTKMRLSLLICGEVSVCVVMLINDEQQTTNIYITLFSLSCITCLSVPHISVLDEPETGDLILSDIKRT